VRVQILSETSPNIPFTEFNFYNLYRETFENTELGRIKKLLPLHDMAENLGLVRKSMKPKLCTFFLHTRCECGAPGGNDCRTTDRSGVENENMQVFGASLRSTAL